MPLTPDLKAALDLITSALGGVATATPDRFWRPSDAEKAAFGKEHGISDTDLDGYTSGTNTAQSPIQPAADPNNESVLLDYAGFGYRSNGKRWTWTKGDLDNARKLCDRLALAQSPQEADDVIYGAGKVQQSVAQYLVMVSSVQGQTLFTAPSLMIGTLDGSSTVAQAAAYASAEPGIPPGV